MVGGVGDPWHYEVAKGSILSTAIKTTETQKGDSVALEQIDWKLIGVTDEMLNNPNLRCTVTFNVGINQYAKGAPDDSARIVYFSGTYTDADRLSATASGASQTVVFKQVKLSGMLGDFFFKDPNDGNVYGYEKIICGSSNINGAGFTTSAVNIYSISVKFSTVSM